MIFNPTSISSAKWIGTAAGVSGAIMIALNLGLIIYGFGLSLRAARYERAAITAASTLLEATCWGREHQRLH